MSCDALNKCTTYALQPNVQFGLRVRMKTECIDDTSAQPK